VPRRPFEEVRSFPHLGERWAIAKHEFKTDSEWHRVFGLDAVWPPQGMYYPTDAVLKPGLRPNMSLTEYMIQAIKQTWSVSAMKYEEEIQAEIDREDRFTFRTLIDMAEDSCTAFGKIPGSRGNSSTSLPDPPRKRKPEVIVCP